MWEGENSLNSGSKGRWLFPIFLRREQGGTRIFSHFIFVFNTVKSQKHKDRGTRILLVKHPSVYFSHSLLLYITGSYYLAFSKTLSKTVSAVRLSLLFALFVLWRQEK